MYTAHFRLAECPFSLTPDPRYLYMSERHREGLAHLLYGIQQAGGFVQLTGEVGTGKTTLCRCLLEQLPPGVNVALILNPRLTVVEFLATLCDELHITYGAGTASVKVLVDALHAYLLDAHAQGRRTVLIIDEAQNLSADVLEQVRLLTNLETATEKLLQIILLGQPELAQLLEQRALRQLAQRITARYHLAPFSARDTYAYIDHRLRLAGGSGALFTPGAMRCVRRLSGGVPRLINVLCDRALLGAYAHGLGRVNAATVRRAGREVRGTALRQRRGGRLAWAVGLGAGAIILAAAGMTILGTPTPILIPRKDGPAPVVSAGAQGMPFSRVTGEGLQATGVSLPASPPGATTRNAADQGPSGPRRLLDVLTDPSLRGDDPGAFAAVYALWGLEYRRASSGLGCDAGRSAGLECVFKLGNWTKLRRFNLPAILELTLPTGQRRNVALVRLEGESATLAIGGRESSFPLGEVDRLWDGSFILIWKSPPLAERVITRGMRGSDIEWLRARLDALEGKTPKGQARDVYDAELERRVIAFQQSRSLVPDGRVGGETIAQLVLAARDASTPSLMR